MLAGYKAAKKFFKHAKSVGVKETLTRVIKSNYMRQGTLVGTDELGNK